MSLVAELTDAFGRIRARRVVAGGAEAAAFTRWVDGLPAAPYPALVRLRAYGYADDLDALESQLSAALSAAGVSSAVRAAGQRVLELLASRVPGNCLLLGEELDPT